MKKQLIYCLFFVFASSNIFAQTKNVYKNWQEYFSFYETKQIEQYENIAIVLSENGLFFYNTDSEKITRLTKLQGLSSVELTCMTYDKENEQIFIGYANGMIDVVQLPSFRITSIVDIFQKQIYNSKSINEIQIHNSIAYISTDFGLLSFDVEKMQFQNTTIFGTQGEYISVNQTCIENQTLYAATNNGIFSIAYSKNISDNTLWKHETEFAHGDKKVKNIITFANKIYYVPEIEGSRDIVFVKNESATSQFCTLNSINTLRIVDEKLCVVANRSIEIYAKNQQLEKTITADDLSEIALAYTEFNDICSVNNELFLADKLHGLTNFTAKQTIVPQGIYINSVSDVAFNNGKLYVACRSHNEWLSGMINVLQGGKWVGHRNWHVYNSIALFVPTNSNTYYYGTWGSGVVQSTNLWGFDTIFNEENTGGALAPPVYETKTVSVNKIVGDRKNNVWMLNHYTKKPLVVKTADDKWFSYPLASNYYNSEDLVVDRDNNKWIAGNARIAVFNENGTFENTADDKLITIPLVDKFGVIAGISTCLAIDINGEMWIGTDQGIAVHANPTQAIKGNTTLTRPQIEIDGANDYLLSSERISCIFVDGGNRKWVGTANSGVYLISGSTPLQQLQHFNVDNSPLPSNTITAITINQSTGEVFFATPNGLVSFLSDATIGAAKQEELAIFPNPVRKDYDGEIRIQKLTANVHVRITDIDGNLVFSTTANGGTAVWNGYNWKGERAATGVYFVYVSNDDGSETRVGKLMFIN